MTTDTERESKSVPASTRRTEKGQPVLSWILSVRNCESMLEATLKSLRERSPQAEIVVVDNMSRDNTPAVAKKYADIFCQYRGPEGNWTEEDPWTTNMAASRQKGFEMATGRFRGWVDSDDRIAGPEEAEKLLKLNAQWKPSHNGKPVEGSEKVVTLEEILLEIDKTYPQCDVIWAPYLYARDKDGKSLMWQERERIVKWDPKSPKWHWKEAAHEILVPVPGYTPRMRINLAHLLFVHEREHSAENSMFAYQRHFSVLHGQYQAGERTTRRCLYLAGYATVLCPEREREFIEAAHAAATTMLDRYRALVSLAGMFFRQGMFRDALEAYGAATHVRPDLSDAWFSGAKSWEKINDYGRAIEWLEKGLLIPHNTESLENPRARRIEYPTLLAEMRFRFAKEQIRYGDQQGALASLTKAVDIMRRVKDDPAIGHESMEANAYGMRYENALFAQQSALNISKLALYLLNNDESIKARELLKTVPWNLQDHPLMIELETKLRPLTKHLDDPEAYRAFYNDVVESGYIPSPEEWLSPDKDCLNRARVAADWIKKNKPDALVLDQGSFDGIIGIPLLRSCPGIRYIGVDINAKPLSTFATRIARHNLENRAELHQIKDADDLGRVLGDRRVDVLIWFEVIEHVPDPAAELRKLLHYVKPGGRIFLSTPWGAYDAGHPPEKNEYGRPRGFLGHVRAFTPRDMVDLLDSVDIRTEELTLIPTPAETVGDEMNVTAVNEPMDWDMKGNRIPGRVTFSVPSALWDWNSRTVHTQGMGASEKSIVLVGEALALDGRKVEVYGPVPEADVLAGVRYWPREQIRHVRSGTIVVSRIPCHGKELDEKILVSPLPRILWLQDAFYPDLTAEVAASYKKVVVVSNWHKAAMHELHGVPLEMMEVIYNPIDSRLYRPAQRPERKVDHFVYASSPDRGLIHLLKLWPKILERLPNATLDICYGFRGCQKLGLSVDASWTERYESCRRQFEELRYQKGIAVHDMVSPVRLAGMWMKAGVLAYPTDFSETFGTISAEARAAGCVPVCPPLAGLAESAKCDQGFFTRQINEAGFEEEFLDACVKATKVSEADRILMSEEAIAALDVHVIVEQWKKLLA